MINISPSGRPDVSRSNDVSTARTAYQQQSIGQRPSEATQRGSVDRVSISMEGRAKATTNESEDIAFARHALKATGQLPAERLATVRDRLMSGFYSTEEVRNSIAASLADDLAPSVI